jgi:hypothetical protein
MKWQVSLFLQQGSNQVSKQFFSDRAINTVHYWLWFYSFAIKTTFKTTWARNKGLWKCLVLSTSKGIFHSNSETGLLPITVYSRTELCLKRRRQRLLLHALFCIRIWFWHDFLASQLIVQVFFNCRDWPTYIVTRTKVSLLFDKVQQHTFVWRFFHPGIWFNVSIIE